MKKNNSIWYPSYLYRYVIGEENYNEFVEIIGNKEYSLSTRFWNRIKHGLFSRIILQVLISVPISYITTKIILKIMGVE